MKEFTNHRKNTQPSALYNAGSVFKNGEDYYAAELIENAGLKGFKIDGVRVSEKHSNFFIADSVLFTSSEFNKLYAVDAPIAWLANNINLIDKLLSPGIIIFLLKFLIF